MSGISSAFLPTYRSSAQFSLRLPRDSHSQCGMVTVAEFRAGLSGSDPLEIVDNVLLANAPKHVSQSDLDHISKTLSLEYSVDVSEIELIVTGSASLGFSLVEKRRRDRPPKLRYRSFDAESDIDIAVISTPIFNKIWEELAAFSIRQASFPWDASRLGDYLVCGWFRPDHFPKHVRLARCDQWTDTFNRMSRSEPFRRRRVAGGLFQSKYYLRKYMARAVSECIKMEAFDEDCAN